MTADSSQATPAAIQRLQEEHNNISKLLNILERHLALFKADQSPDYELIKEVADYFMSYPDTCHHPKEDLIYEKLKLRDPRAAEAGNLPEQHAKLAGRTRQFSALVDALLREAQVSRSDFEMAARDFLEYQRTHMLMEEKHFLPAAKRALTDEDWADIEARMSQPDDPLFSDAVESRFESLRRQIIDWDAEDMARSQANQ